MQAVEAAHEDYESARERAVSSKDALRNALAQRDALTEVLRSSPYTTEAEAAAELKQMQNKARIVSFSLPPLLLDIRI